MNLRQAAPFERTLVHRRGQVAWRDAFERHGEQAAEAHVRRCRRRRVARGLGVARTRGTSAPGRIARDQVLRHAIATSTEGMR